MRIFRCATDFVLFLNSTLTKSFAILFPFLISWLHSISLLHPLRTSHSPLLRCHHIERAVIFGGVFSFFYFHSSNISFWSFIFSRSIFLSFWIYSLCHCFCPRKSEHEIHSKYKCIRLFASSFRNNFFFSFSLRPEFSFGHIAKCEKYKSNKKMSKTNVYIKSKCVCSLVPFSRWNFFFHSISRFRLNNKNSTFRAFIHFSFFLGSSPHLILLVRSFFLLCHSEIVNYIFKARFSVFLLLVLKFTTRNQTDTDCFCIFIFSVEICVYFLQMKTIIWMKIRDWDLFTVYLSSKKKSCLK